MKYQVIRKIKGFYYVVPFNDGALDFDNIIECKLKGTLKKTNSKYNCMIGDIVSIDKDTICHIYDRKHILERPLIANVDNIFITLSVVEPNFDIINLQKILLYINKNNINYTLILTKCDLVDEQYLNEVVEKIQNTLNINIIKRYKDSSIKEIEKILLEYKLNVFLGASGVGKSTLLNQLLGSSEIVTQEISEKLKRGKNTTVESRFYNYKNISTIVDTPGFSTIDFPKLDNYLEIYEYFPDFIDYFNCKFRDCKHLSEINCTIKEALNNGINIQRYEFYKLFLERAINE